MLLNWGCPLLLVGCALGEDKMTNWHPAKLSTEAHRILKLSSALTGRDMRELASTAILDYCKHIVRQALPRIRKFK